MLLWSCEKLMCWLTIEIVTDLQSVSLHVTDSRQFVGTTGINCEQGNHWIEIHMNLRHSTVGHENDCTGFHSTAWDFRHHVHSLVGHDAMQFLTQLPICWRNLLPPSSRYKMKMNKWRQQFHPKCWYPCADELYGIILQKDACPILSES